MTAVELLLHASENAYSELQTSIKDLTEFESWDVLESADEDYLHSDGSIHGILLHVATCKFVFGSVGFRNSEIRWRDVAERLDAFEPSWSDALDYLAEAHDYWLSCWSNLKDSDLDLERPHFRGKSWPTWKILDTVTHHDMYHAGQIAVIRYATKGSDVRPPSVAEDIRKYCADLPTW